MASASRQPQLLHESRTRHVARARQPRALQPGQPVCAARRRLLVLRRARATPARRRPCSTTSTTRVQPDGIQAGDHILRRRRRPEPRPRRVRSEPAADRSGRSPARGRSQRQRRARLRRAGDHKGTSRSPTSAAMASPTKTSPATTRSRTPIRTTTTITIYPQPARHRGQRRLRPGRAVRGRRARRRRRDVPAGDTPPPGIAVATTTAKATASGTCRRTSRAGTRTISTKGSRARRRPSAPHGHVVRRRHPRLLQQLVAVEPAIASAMADGARRSACGTASPPSSATRTTTTYDFTTIDWTRSRRTTTCATAIPTRHPTTIMMGDGRHVGTPTQAIYRSRPRSRGSIAAGPTAISPTARRGRDAARSDVHIADHRSS